MKPIAFWPQQLLIVVLRAMNSLATRDAPARRV